MKRYGILVSLFVILACRREADEPTPTELPACIQTIIQQNGRVIATSQNFVAITRYKYQKRYVYFALSDCCDSYNVLLDNACQTLCLEGGFSGQGDGKCPDFFKEATEKTEIWQRPR